MESIERVLKNCHSSSLIFPGVSFSPFNCCCICCSCCPCWTCSGCCCLSLLSGFVFTELQLMLFTRRRSTTGTTERSTRNWNFIAAACHFGTHFSLGHPHKSTLVMEQLHSSVYYSLRLSLAYPVQALVPLQLELLQGDANVSADCLPLFRADGILMDRAENQL